MARATPAIHLVPPVATTDVLGDVLGDVLEDVRAPRERRIGARRTGDKRIGAVSVAIRFVLFVLWMAVCCVGLVVSLVVCLPSRPLRIKVGNFFGHVIGCGGLWLSGSCSHVVGAQHLDAGRPAIYVANHASTFDILLGIWLAPIGACGVAKKEIILYPFFGLFYVLAGHLRIDRANARRAITSLHALAALVRRHRLSIFIWPEGHRSNDGRLMPFKKGAFHLALATGLPIVPVVIAGSQRAWEARTMNVTRTTVDITCLPAIDTRHWTEETLREHMREVHDLFVATLPADQRPLSPSQRLRYS